MNSPFTLRRLHGIEQTQNQIFRFGLHIFFTIYYSFTISISIHAHRCQIQNRLLLGFGFRLGEDGHVSVTIIEVIRFFALLFLFLLLLLLEIGDQEDVVYLSRQHFREVAGKRGRLGKRARRKIHSREHIARRVYKSHHKYYNTKVIINISMSNHNPKILIKKIFVNLYTPLTII